MVPKDSGPPDSFFIILNKAKLHRLLCLFLQSFGGLATWPPECKELTKLHSWWNAVNALPTFQKTMVSSYWWWW